jgi:uncharacterized RDD family membrane protein YckC
MVYSNPWKRLGAYILDGFILSTGLGIIINGILFPTMVLPYALKLDGDLMAALNAADEGPAILEAATQFFFSMMPFMIVSMLFTTVVYGLYFALMESSSYQATLGKKVFGLKVCGADGARISFKKASLRFFVKYICWPLFFLFAVIFFTEKKQTLHDLAAGTIVVDAKPA